MKRSIPILLYHHISPDREMTPQAFERQLRFLLDQGYESLSMDEVLAVSEGRRPVNHRAFAVTFDDGYLDNWLCAFPILQKLGVKAAMYLVTERVENEAKPRRVEGMIDTKSSERAPGGFLSWSEVGAMAASGLVTFGSHTHTHRHFVRQEPYENLDIELRQSKRLIEEHLGRSCDHLAWPWGDFETAWWKDVRSIGYRTAVTTLSGANTTGTNPLSLKRLKMSRPSVDWFARRLRWSREALPAALVGPFHGLDRRFKSWIQSESPYSHG
jgi:peptidoglycan/xylan/chitin deacetylase (PgdA/CDA1 family)